MVHLNSLSFILLFNKLKSTTPEYSSAAQFLQVLKQNAHIFAVKIIANKSYGRFMFSFGNTL